MSDYIPATEADLVEKWLDEILTQYRESPNLLAMIRVYTRVVANVVFEARRLIEHYFDLNTAVGDQLTILGKALGWPRCHCAGQRRPVFGFACDGEDVCNIPTVPIAGFCQAEWDCDGPEFVEFCFTDDELYRRFLKARRITLTGDYTRDGVTAAAREVFGPLAVIYDERPGVVAIATGRVLSSVEISIAHLYEQVLPVPPGARLEIWHSDGAPFGFGDGWGQLCYGGGFPVLIPIS